VLNTEAHPLPIRGRNAFHRGVKTTTKASEAAAARSGENAAAEDLNENAI
jgi:hypothetical protein